MKLHVNLKFETEFLTKNKYIKNKYLLHCPGVTLREDKGRKARFKV